MLLAGLLVFSPAWITSSQAQYGTSLDTIRRQMNGEDIPGLHPQVGLSMLWTHNPEGDGRSDEGQDDGPISEALHGLGGGITWAWDTALCHQLLPLFREHLIVYNQLVDCEGIRAAVQRAFNKWETNSRFMKLVDMTNECEKLGINHGPPRRHSEDRGDGQYYGLAQAPNLPYHGGCPLAEIWVTSLSWVTPSAASATDRRLQDSVGEGREQPATWDGETISLISSQELGGGLAVATAFTYLRPTHNFRFTNGARPFRWTDSGNVSYKRSFIEAYAGKLSIRVDPRSSDGSHRFCWYLDSYFCSQFHAFKARVGSPASARLVLGMIAFGVSGLTLLYVFLRFMYVARWARDPNLTRREPLEVDQAPLEFKGSLSGRCKCMSGEHPALVPQMARSEAWRTHRDPWPCTCTCTWPAPPRGDTQVSTGRESFTRPPTGAP